MSGLTSQMNLYSLTRMALTLGPSLGFLVFLHTSTMNHRPDITDSEHRVKDVPLTDLLDSYDFIVIGGGSAGAVMANRLSEVPNWNVLLLEAGPDEFVVSDMPIMFPVLQLSPLDWQFKTEPGDRYFSTISLTNSSSSFENFLYSFMKKNSLLSWSEKNPRRLFDFVICKQTIFKGLKSKYKTSEQEAFC